MVAIEVKNLTKIYRAGFGKRPKVALDDVSLRIEIQEVFGLIGPNGSGKTTLFRILLGLTNPTKGKVDVLGKSPLNVAVKNRIGYLPEGPYFYEFLTAEELLVFYGKAFELEKGLLHQRCEELLKSFGLWQARNFRLKAFSKGMLQRIGICCALINDPELVLLDEPSLGLDPLGIVKVRDLLAKLKAKGKTVIVSSHIISETENICDRVGILHKGRLLKVAQPKSEGPLEKIFIGTIRGYEEDISAFAKYV